MVPAPSSSRKKPMSTRAKVKPRPMTTPSIADGRTLFLDAYASARPRMMQFTTISGRNRPRDDASDGRNACMDRSIMVTKVAMIVMNAAIRILSGIILRIAEITILEQMRTTVAAAPMPIAFCREVVVASVGQRPIVCMKTGLSRITPDFSCSENFIVAFPP